MEHSLTITVKGVAKAEGKAVGEVKVLKTQSIISYKDLDDLAKIEKDMKVMGLFEADLIKVVVDFKKAKAAGRLVNRCMVQLARIKVIVPEELSWEQEGGKVIFNVEDMFGNDAYPLCHILCGLADRARKKMSYTHHALTMYDIEQSVGLVWAASQGEEDAVMIREWLAGYVNMAKESELDDLKAKREKAKAAKSKAGKAEKTSKKVVVATEKEEAKAVPLVVDEEEEE